MDINPDVTATALYMGEHFQQIKDFYSAVKSTLNQCQEFHYSLAEANIPLADNSRVVSFTRGLYNIGYLSSFAYKKAPHRIITAQVNRLEYYIHFKAVSILTGEYACVRNLNVTLPGNE